MIWICKKKNKQQTWAGSLNKANKLLTYFLYFFLSVSQ